jgi:hypothetical protein
MHPSRFFQASALCAALVAIPGSAALAAPSPKERVEAQKLAAEGRKAMKEKRWTDAIGALKRAEKLDPIPALALDLAQALIAGGKLVEAQRVLVPLAESSDNAPPARRAREAAKKALGDLKPRIASVKVRVEGPPASNVMTTIDGLDVDANGEVALNPGDHSVGATADGWKPGETGVRLAEGEHLTVKLQLVASAPPPPPAKETAGSRVPGAVVLSLGAAGLAVGGVFGGLAFSATSSAKSLCKGDVCPLAAQDDINRSKLYGNVSTAAFIAGGAVALTGIVLTAVAPGGKKGESKEKAGVSPWVGLREAGLTGRF